MTIIEIENEIIRLYGVHVGRLFIDSLGDAFPTIEEYRFAKTQDDTYSDFIHCLGSVHIKELIIDGHNFHSYGRSIEAHIMAKLRIELESDCEFAWSMYEE